MMLNNPFVNASPFCVILDDYEFVVLENEKQNFVFWVHCFDSRANLVLILIHLFNLASFWFQLLMELDGLL